MYEVSKREKNTFLPDTPFLISKTWICHLNLIEKANISVYVIVWSRIWS